MFSTTRSNAKKSQYHKNTKIVKIISIKIILCDYGCNKILLYVINVTRASGLVVNTLFFSPLLSTKKVTRISAKKM